MKNTIIIFTILIFSLKAFSSQLLILTKGSTHFISTKPSEIVRVSNSKVVKITDHQTKIQIYAKKLGRSYLHIGKRSYEVLIIETKLKKTLNLLKTWVKKKMGLSVQATEKAIYLKGELLRLSDWIELSELSKEQNLEFKFGAKLSTDLQQEAKMYFETLLEKEKVKIPLLKFSPTALAISNQDSHLQEVQQSLGHYGFSMQKDKESLHLEPMVEVEILVTELRKNKFRKFGVEWPASYKASLVPALDTSNTPLEVVLHALEQSGEAKILASPKLLCRSGKQAQFLAGGEFPLKLMNYKINDVVWKKYGVLLKINPVVDLSGRMSIALETEVSMIDPSTTVDGVPGLLTNRIQSHFDLQKPRTIALSGLIKNELSKAKSGIPILSQIPILGSLFSSEDYRNNQTELVVFVTPKLVSFSEAQVE